MFTKIATLALVLIVAAPASATKIFNYGTEALTSPPSDVSELDRAVFQATNRLRTDPKSFLPYLETRLTYFDGKVVNMPNS